MPDTFDDLDDVQCDDGDFDREEFEPDREARFPKGSDRDETPW